MARKKAEKQADKRLRRGRRRFAGPVLLLVFLICAGFFGWMRFNAGLIRLEYADVYLPDLPAGFDGSTLLYISDLNISSEADARACANSLEELAALQPDMLLLGGDYTAPTLVEMLNGHEAGKDALAQPFIEKLASFPAKLGKFAVAGEKDDPTALEQAFSASGVQLLTDSCAQVQKNGDSLVIAGLSDVSRRETPYEQIGGYFTGDECVVALAHNPSAYVGVRVAEAKGGGAWADMVLSGHTLGGQIKIGERTLLSYTDEEARCISGWYYGDDLPMLVSQGYQCRGLNLRLGTLSEVWLITLRRPEEITGYELPLL